MRETYKTIENVDQLEKNQTKCNGRLANFYFIHTSDGALISFKCKDYEIERIEA